MDEAMVAQREREIREQHPKQFDHPERRSNEIWRGNLLLDLVNSQCATYQKNGMPSVRVGKNLVLRDEVAYYPIFIDLREMIIAEAEYARTHPQQLSLGTAPAS